jgi:hypothetical protein
MGPVFDADAEEREMYEFINNATQYDLLKRWRFAPSGDPIFQGDVGDYFMRRQRELRSKDPAGYTAASKRLGW